MGNHKDCPYSKGRMQLQTALSGHLRNAARSDAKKQGNQAYPGGIIFPTIQAAECTYE